MIRFYEDTILDYNTRPQTLADTHLTSLDGYTSKTNSYLTSLLSSADSIKNYKDSITSADRSIKEKELSLAKLQDTDELSIRAKKIAVQQKEDALTTAKETLVDCSVYAPFAGVVAKVSLKKGDTASSGATVATLVTKQNIAEVSLNEVDAAKVKVGNKATLTFDAVSDLSITGTVAEVDSLGTVSQGVVTYTIKINFDTQDDRIKPGMSVSASIITDSQQDVLTVPNAAVKTSGNTSYVEIPDETVSSQSSDTINGVLLTKTPKQQVVEIGLANDTMTEIKSGLIEGDTVIIRTVTTNGTSSTNTSSSRSILQSGGVRTSGGGNVMMIPRD